MADIYSITDESLLARICDGDHQAFAILVRRHTNRFFAAAYRFTGHVQEAEDVVQEAFLKLWQKPQAWDEKRGVRFTTWFYRVVVNGALDTVRKKRPQDGQDVLDGLGDGRESVESLIQKAEYEEILENAIQALPERQRAALNLCFYEEMSNKEAAEILDVNIKALESLLMRAKAGLRDILTRQGLLEMKDAG